MTITLGKIALLTKEKIDMVSYSLYLFILVFAPPIVPYPHLLLTIFSFLMLATAYKRKVWIVLKRSGIYNWILASSLLAMYTVCIPLPISMFCNDIVNTTHYISIINRYGVLMVTVSVCLTYLLCKTDKDGYNYEFLLESLINAGLIEGICAALAFLFPGVKNIFIFFMKEFSESYLYSNTWYITVRSYGFASTLVDVFGLGIGLIAGISFFYGVTKKKKYIIKSIIIAIATLLNSRTGLIVYLLAIIISFLFMINGKNIKRILTVLCAIVFLSVCGLELLKIMSTNEYTAGWFSSGINSITSFFDGTKSNNGGSDAMSLLFQNKFWKWPSFPRILVGTGHSLYLAQGYSHSDVGYVNEVWVFGIFGCAILYGEIVKLCRAMTLKANKDIFKFSSVFLLVAYFFFNIKGGALGYNPGAVAMFVVVFITIYFNNKNTENKTESGV
ncbi:hypothetical protein [uncultured Faecalibaculum sp.]|uniref:hypothetical protein n=1 Tax=uncultured Faecalibaculum sp. TaxID=1729681 RepID=UPI00272E72CD|nr:hypothetical protein [uncultured Faecalibaculum sp.]